MLFAAGIAAAAALAALVLLALTWAGAAFWLLRFLRDQIPGWLPGGGWMRDRFQDLENASEWIARKAIQAIAGLLTLAAQIIHAGVTQIAGVLTIPIVAQVVGLIGLTNQFGGVLFNLVVGPPETKVPEAFKRLNDALQRLPNEPAFRSSGPLQRFLRFISELWGVATRLGGFARFIAGPILGLVALAELVIDWLSPLFLLPGKLAELTNFANNLDYFRKQDEARIAQLAIQINAQQAYISLLQVDLERERAARVAALLQEQQARQGAERLQEARRLADRSQWSPLLILAVLAALGAEGVNVLRRTAECDPCKRIDDDLSDLPWRVRALEAYGEP